VQQQIADSYTQLKVSSEGKYPTMLVLYNNAGILNWIDSFTISKAMFGSFGMKLGFTKEPDTHIVVVKQGFFGNRKITKESCRALSVVAVMNDSCGKNVKLCAYHNPFAAAPIATKSLSQLASSQFLHGGIRGHHTYFFTFFS
jgi:hypothetical protein